MNDIQSWLRENLPIGRRNAAHMKYIADIMHIKKREVRKEVEKARLSGCLICGDENGYYYPDSIAELRKYIMRASAKIKTGKECLTPFIEELAAAEERGGL